MSLCLKKTLTGIQFFRSLDRVDAENTEDFKDPQKALAQMKDYHGKQRVRRKARSHWDDAKHCKIEDSDNYKNIKSNRPIVNFPL